MIQANIHQAKTQLSRLIERAEAGEEVVIARNGKPAVRLAPVEPEVRGGSVVGTALRSKIAFASAAERLDDPLRRASGRRRIVGCMADDAAIAPEAYLRRLDEEIATAMLDTAKFDVELDDELEFIPAAVR